MKQSLRQRVAELESKEKEHQELLRDLQQHNDITNALNEILRISLKPISLNEQLSLILKLVVEIPWVTLEKKGSFFLSNHSNELEMSAYLNLSPTLLTMCSKVPFGTCLCGLAAERKEPIFKNCVDHEHNNRPEGMTPHGHYNLPIMLEDKVIGVFNLYVEHGHAPNPLELNFLTSVCNQVASIIERKKMEEELHKLSFSDPLTGLPNRRYMIELIQKAIARGKRDESGFALLFLDLNKFKSVNDQLGHDVGDQLLCKVAEIFHHCVRESDTVGRLGGDEFLIYLEQIPDIQNLNTIQKRIKDNFQLPLILSDNTIETGVSVGMSIYPTDGDTSAKLLAVADKRMYIDKHNH